MDAGQMTRQVTHGASDGGGGHPALVLPVTCLQTPGTPTCSRGILIILHLFRKGTYLQAALLLCIASFHGQPCDTASSILISHYNAKETLCIYWPLTWSLPHSFLATCSSSSRTASCSSVWARVSPTLVPPLPHSSLTGCQCPCLAQTSWSSSPPTGILLCC